MRRSRKRDREPENAPNEGSVLLGEGAPKPSRTDILAVIIALFQLVLPLVLGLLIVGVIIALILR